MKYWRADTLDYTATLLVAAAVYTGNTRRIDQYEKLTGTIITDQNGTALIQQSSDGTNWDYETSLSLTAGTGAAFNVDAVGLFARIKITNTAGADQTYLRGYLIGRAG